MTATTPTLTHTPGADGRRAAPAPAGRRPAVVVAALLCALVALAPVAPLRAQDEGEDELTRVRRDQSRLVTRLPTLREKMERLAARYEDEGRTRNAVLLREALAQYDAQALLDVAREVERSLDQTKLSSIERQDELLGALEGIYAVLRDRRDVEDLRSQADLARQGASEMGFLAENQRRLLNETRALTDRPDELLAEAEAAAERLERELQTAASALEELAAARAVLGEAALAADLARQQAALARDADATAEAQGMLQAALELLRERLARPADAGRGELAANMQADRAAAAGAAERAAEAMAAARERLPSASGARSESTGRTPPGEATTPSGSEPASTPDETSGEREASASDAGATSSPPAASEPSAPASEDPDGAGESSPSGSPSPSGGPTPSGAAAPRDGSTPGPAAESEPRDAEAGAGSAGDSEPEAGAASDSEPEAVSAEAREAMQAAAEELREVADALSRAERAATAMRNREQALAQASSREAEAAGETLEDRAERLEALQPEEGPELLDRTREMLAELANAAEAVESGDAARAQAQLDRAALDLAALRAMLDARARAGSASRPEATPEDLQSQLDDLAERQDELREQTRRLMERLSELPDQQFRPALERAQQAMQGSSDALRRGDEDEAEQREEEAAEQLDEAQAELARDRDRYEQLRQEEVLFQIGEELDVMHEAQTAINEETVQLGEGRDGDGRLGRSQRRALARLSAQQSDLTGRTDEVRAALEEDGAITFVFAVDEIRTDMQRSADLLADERTDLLVRSVQDDVLRRIEDLQAVLAAEEERRRQAAKEQQGQQPQGEMPENSRMPLVPRVAELYLIQRLEQAALRRLEGFEQLNPEIFDEDRYAEVQRQLLERWAFEHARVTEMFEQLMPEPPPEGGDMLAPGLDGRPRGEGEGSSPAPPGPDTDDGGPR